MEREEVEVEDDREEEEELIASATRLGATRGSGVEVVMDELDVGLTAVGTRPEGPTFRELKA